MSEPSTDKARRLWIVDDSPLEAAVTVKALGDRYEYEVFNDGSVVVERLGSGREQPDALLLDWVMPGMSGDEVTRFLRSQPETKDLPIILVTASRVETSDIVTGLALGANDYVARPFAPEELRARVDSVIRARRAAEGAARERSRLATINQLGRSLFRSGTDVAQILEVLVDTLTESLCDGCSILLLPGELPEVFVSRHRGEARGEALSQIAAVADPAIHAFASSAQARATLPPAYHSYIDRFGLRGLAILPFPILSPVQGVVTVTRDGDSEPFDADDLAMIETCIEYAALGVQKAVRYETERTARDQLNAVLENLPLGIIATTDAGTITLSNSTARRMIPGLEHAHHVADLYGLADWIDAEGRPLGQWELSAQRELIMRRGDTTTHFAITSVPLPRGRGATVGAVTVLQDVTRERATAHEREQISRFTQRLLGIVGHDLRSPLGAFVAGLSLLEMRGDSQPVQPIVQRLQSSARRMTRIVDQLLDVTRATLGTGIQIDRRPTNLGTLVRGVVDEIRVQQPDAKISVVGDGEISGHWDPDRLEQVLSNLLTNALYYGRPGAPIVVEIARASQQVSIVVKNELRDRPIPPDVLAVLFDPHRRGGEARHNAAGLGLGLYIVQQIVHAHRGVIVAHSDNGGTEFRVTLPE
ncbi:MAG TPA: ATP-binding protein [Kofleriaceae bacterium]|nr:ATP-binding protein [Kofleriaceae bacterium]